MTPVQPTLEAQTRAFCLTEKGSPSTKLEVNLKQQKNTESDECTNINVEV